MRIALHTKVRADVELCCWNGSAAPSSSRTARRAAVRCTSTPATAPRPCPWCAASPRSSRATTPSSPPGSCTARVRDHHGVVASRYGDAALAESVEHVVPTVSELSKLLVDVLGVTDVGAYFPHRVTYHPTCHSLRMLRVGDRPLRLLRAVKGIDLVELPAAESCCGFGGTFALKNSEVSNAMLDDKMRHVQETGADFLCASDNSCLTHIGGGLSRLRTGVGTLHLAEILASMEGDVR